MWLGCPLLYEGKRTEIIGIFCIYSVQIVAKGSLCCITREKYEWNAIGNMILFILLSLQSYYLERKCETHLYARPC